MKLGEMLVRDGRLTEQQLEAALRFQARDGGRLGTVLVEHEMVDLEALTVYLGLELGIPIATGAMLERAKRAAVRLLQPAQAFKHKCVPLVVQDRQLIAAIEDPHDFGTLEALNHVTGYRVLPRVAPEVLRLHVSRACHDVEPAVTPLVPDRREQHAAIPSVRREDCEQRPVEQIPQLGDFEVSAHVGRRYGT